MPTVTGGGPAFFGTPNWSDAAQVVASSGWELAFPVTNLIRNMQPTRPALTTGSGSIVSWTLDRGAAKPVNWASPLATNASAGASWRRRGAMSLAELDTAPVYDSSAVWRAESGLITHAGFGSHLRFDGILAEATATNATWASLGAVSLEHRLRLDAQRHQDVWTFGDRLTLTILGDGTIRFYDRVTPGNLTLESAAGVAQVGKWVHISCGHDEGANTATLIVNGVVADSASGVTANMIVGDTLTLAPDLVRRLEGRLDDIRIYDFQRSAAQHLADTRAPLASPFPGSLVGYWPGDEGSGSAGNMVAGPSLTLSNGADWAFPDRLWASPDISDWERENDRIHGFSYDRDAVVYRYEKVEIRDPNPDGHTRIGRYQSGLGHQMGVSAGEEHGGIRFGAIYGHTDPSDRRRLASGHGPMVVKRPTFPKQRFVVLSVNEREALIDLMRITMTYGASSDIVMCQRPHNDELRHATMIWGLLDAENETIRPDYGIFEAPFTIQGLI